MEYIKQIMHENHEQIQMLNGELATIRKEYDKFKKQRDGLVNACMKIGNRAMVGINSGEIKRGKILDEILGIIDKAMIQVEEG